MTPRRTQRVVSTGRIVIDGYKAESWFISLVQPSTVEFTNLVGGRLYCLLFVQSGGNTVTWPAGINAAPLDLRGKTVSVQAFIADGSAPYSCKAISAMVYA